jgi:hypothetical protein
VTAEGAGGGTRGGGEGEGRGGRNGGGGEGGIAWGCGDLRRRDERRGEERAVQGSWLGHSGRGREGGRAILVLRSGSKLRLCFLGDSLTGGNTDTAMVSAILQPFGHGFLLIGFVLRASPPIHWTGTRTSHFSGLLE